MIAKMTEKMKELKSALEAALDRLDCAGRYGNAVVRHMHVNAMEWYLDRAHTLWAALADELETEAEIVREEKRP